MIPQRLLIILFLVLSLIYVLPKTTANAAVWEALSPLPSDNLLELIDFNYAYDPSINKVIMTYQYKNITGSTIKSPRVVNLFLWSNDICSITWETMNYNGSGTFSNSNQSATAVDPAGYFNWHGEIHTSPNPPLESSGMFPSLPLQATQSGVSYPYWDISTITPGQWVDGEIATFSTPWTVSHANWVQSVSWIVYDFAGVKIRVVDTFATPADVGVKVDLCLDNKDYEVGGVQVDVCEEIDGEPVDCLTCVGCELSERTVLFDCFVNEVDGCCRVILISKNPGGVINPGLCNIVKIDYSRNGECDAGDCITLIPENATISDPYGRIVKTEEIAGEVCPFTCGDVHPAESAPGAGDCGDGDVDLMDIMTEVDFALGAVPDDCQALRADVPTGTPGRVPTVCAVGVDEDGCCPPDGSITIFDIMTLIDMALDRQDCCTYYYTDVIY